MILSKEEEALAKSEGWGLHNGVIEHRLLDGRRIHYMTLQIYEFLYDRANEGSELHKKVLLNAPWMGYENEIALERYKWELVILPYKDDCYFNSPTNRGGREKYPLKFSERIRAVEQDITEKAKEGNTLHAKAIATITKYRFLGYTTP